MLSRYARMTAAVLSGVTASLLVGATTTQAAQSEPVVVYAEPLENVRTERVSYADLQLATARVIGVTYMPPRTYGLTVGYQF